MQKKVRPIEIGKHEYEEYKKSFYHDEAGFVQYAVMILQVLEDWYKDEYDMLKLLAQDDVDSFKELAEEDLFIKHLKNYGIIEQDDTKVGYHFKIESLGNYLSGKLKYKRIVRTIEEKEAEIQSRRSKIEKLLRALVKRQLKSSLGENVAKEVMIRELYGAKEIGHKSNIPYAEFFDSKKHKIYLKTLFDVIVKNYDIFKNLFDIKEEEFKSKAQLLNTYRRTDSHAIPITSEDFDIFRGIASWFEGVLSEE